MDEFNNEIVIATLKQVVEILEDNKIEYRFLGSIVIAAINGTLHRNIGDLDFIVDSQKRQILASGLKQLGYKPAKGLFTFSRKYLSLEQFEHPELLGVGYFYGSWHPDGSFVIGNKGVNMSIDAVALKKTKYSLLGIEFFGIPEEAVSTGINASKSNPKRKKELIILEEKGIKPLPNNYLKIRMFNIRFDWIYHLSMTVLNIIGTVRIKLGLPFDPWR